MIFSKRLVKIGNDECKIRANSQNVITVFSGKNREFRGKTINFLNGKFEYENVFSDFVCDDILLTSYSTIKVNGNTFEIV